MQAWSFRLGRWLGVDVRVHALFLLLLVITSAAAAAARVGGSRGLALAFVVFSAVAVREIARALTALALELDLTHVLLLPTGALDTYANERSLTPAREFLLALTGPLANALTAATVACLALASSPAVELIGRPLFAVGHGGTSQISVLHLLRSLVWANALLAVLHLVPALPLDAGRVFRAAIERTRGAATATRAAGGLSRLLALGLVLGGLAFGSPVLGLTGTFLLLATSLDRRSVVTDSAIDSVRMRDVMLENFDTLSGADTLEEALHHALHVTQDVFPVLRSGSLVGAVSRQSMLEAMARGGNSYVQGIMTRALAPAAPDDPVLAALRRVGSGSGAQLVPVVEGERVVGIVTPQNLSQSTRLLSRLRSFRRMAAGNGSR